MNAIRNTVQRLSGEFFEEIISVRRHLHSKPELSFEEYATCAYISSRLKDAGISHQSGVVKTGVVGIIEGKNPSRNIGTIMRTCDGAAIDAVLICNRRARLTHPKILKGSMGAAFTLPIVEYDSVEACKMWLTKHKFAIYLADTRAEKSYHQYEYRGRAALIVGSERYGITREWYDGPVNRLSIPMLGACDSLNVGVATSIILYEMSLKQKKMK